METNALKHFHHQSQQQSKFNNSHLHHHQQQQHQHQHHHHQHQTANNNANSNTQQLTNQFHSNLINNTNLTNSYLNFNFTQSNQNEIDLINSNRKFFPANLTATNHHHHHHHQNNNSDNRFLSTITSNSSIISPSTIGSVQSSIVCKPIPTTAPITSIQQNATINSSHKNFANNINFQSYTNLNSSSNSISNNNSNQRNATNGINNAVVGQPASTATSATINATKIKPIAAFPLLLSSIESGQQQQQNFGSNVSNSIFKRPFQTTVQQINGSLNQRSNGPKSDKIKSKSKETTKVSGKDSSSSKSRSNGSNSATASKSISVVKSSSSSSGSNHLNHHSHHLLDQNGTIVPTNNLKNGLVNGRDGCFSRENSSSVTPVSLFKNKSNFSNFPSSDDRNRTLPYMKNVNLGSGSNDPIIGLSNSFNSTHPNPAFSTNSQTTASSFQHHLAGKNVDSTTSTLFLNHHRSNLNPSGQCNVSFNNNNHNGDQLLFQSRTGVGSTSINSDAIASIVKSTSNCANNFDNHHLLYTRRGDFIANSSSSLDRPQLDGEKNLSDGVVVSNNSNNLFVLNNRKLASFPLLATTSSSSSSITNTSAVDGQVSKSIHELNGHSNELFNANKTKPILFKIFKEKAKASKSSNGDKSTTIIGLSGKEKVNNTNSNLNSNGKTQSKSVKPVLSSSKISKRSKKTSEPNSAIKTKSRKKSSKFSSLPAASSASISSSSSSSPSTSSTILNRCKLSLSPPSQPPPPSSSSLSLSSLPSSSVSAFTKPTSTAINRLIVDGGGGGGGGLVNHKSSNHCQQEIQIEKNCTINSSSSTSSSSTFHLKQQQQNHHHYQNNATSVRIESDRNIETINSDQKCFVDPSDRSLLFDSIRPIKEIFYTEYLIDNFALQVFSNENDLMRAVDESEKLRRSRTQNGDPWSSAPDDDDDDDDGDGDDDDDDDGEENDDDHQQRKSSTLPNQNDKTKASVNDLRNRTKHCDQIVLVRRSPSPLTSSREPSPIPSTRRNSSISAASSSASSASISSDSEDDSDFSDEEEEEDDDEDDDDDEEEEEEDEDRNDEDSQSSQESDSNPKSKNNNRRSKTLVSSKGKNSKNINRKKVVGGRQKFKQKSTRTVSNQKRKSIQSSSSTSSTTTTTTTSLKSKIKCSHRHPKNQSACSKCLSLNRKQQTNLSTRKSNLKRSITAATTANKNRLKRKSQTVKSIGVGGRLGQKGVIASTARSRKSQTSKSSPTKLVQSSITLLDEEIPSGLKLIFHHHHLITSTISILFFVLSPFISMNELLAYPTLSDRIDLIHQKKPRRTLMGLDQKDQNIEANFHSERFFLKCSEKFSPFLEQFFILREEMVLDQRFREFKIT
ncbi:hypothetical protein NH340_JMT00185 [Sarcoptes scabiei]|nr:hypothetical protein NH340_JMT00185 [Sarcoptes scabiei]